MRLRRVRLTRFRQFKDQELRLDPSVTVVVGRNDTGKTGVLWQFFNQPFYEGVLHSGDRPLIREVRGQPIEFAMAWDVEALDKTQVETLFGRLGQRIDLVFRDQEGPAKRWRYFVDGEEVEAYSGVGEDGQPILRAELAPRRLFPTPQYLSIVAPVMSQFEARLLQPPGETTVPARPLAATHEASLLRLAGLGGETRAIQGTWTEWPPAFFPRRELPLDEVEGRLAEVSARITRQLRAWWTDPPGLTFTLRLAGNNEGKRRSHDINSYFLVWGITDPQGLPLHGAGLLWFFTLLVNLELLGEHPRPLLLLFDEPAAPLHPSAQRMVTRLLDSLASRRQIIYSSHSPFLIDWNFPQRIRVFSRDPETRATTIQNTPYAGGRQIWDPLRESIGVTVGDVAVIGPRNVFVEGISDQIILANASRALETSSSTQLDLQTTSIIPYGTEPVLKEMLGRVQGAGVRAVVVVDRDAAGKKAAAIAAKLGVPIVEASGNRPDADDCSIEDVIGLTEYLDALNQAYEGTERFQRLTPDEVQANRRTKSLGAFLDQFFEERLERSFSKVSVSVVLAERFRESPGEIPRAVRDLIGRVVEALG